LEEVYFERNIPIIVQRLGMAGARLAHLLNSIYDPNSEYPENIDLHWELKLNINKNMEKK